MSTPMYPDQPGARQRRSPSVPAPLEVWTAQAVGAVTDSHEGEGPFGASGVVGWLRQVATRAAQARSGDTTVTIQHSWRRGA